MSMLRPLTYILCNTHTKCPVHICRWKHKEILQQTLGRPNAVCVTNGERRCNWNCLLKTQCKLGTAKGPCDSGEGCANLCRNPAKCLALSLTALDLLTSGTFSFCLLQLKSLRWEQITQLNGSVFAWHFWGPRLNSQHKRNLKKISWVVEIFLSLKHTALRIRFTKACYIK